MKVLSLGSPPLGAHWSFGPDHMCRISEAVARRLLKSYPLPRIGYETVAAGSRQTGELYVQNISGHYYLACATASMRLWPELFGVQITKEN